MYKNFSSSESGKIKIKKFFLEGCVQAVKMLNPEQCCSLYTCVCVHKHMCTHCVIMCILCTHYVVCTHCVIMCTHEYLWVEHIYPKFSFVVNNKSIKEINSNSIPTTISLVCTQHVYTCVHTCTRVVYTRAKSS